MLIRYGKFVPRYCLWNLATILVTTVFYHRIIQKCPTWTIKEITMRPIQHLLYSWWSTNLLKTTQPFIGKKKRIFFTWKYVILFLFKNNINCWFDNRKITECFMSLKEDVTKDLLCVAAHGTPQARSPAANLLFYYWPSLNPTAYDRRNILGKFNTSPTWKPPPCRYLFIAQTSAH